MLLLAKAEAVTIIKVPGIPELGNKVRVAAEIGADGINIKPARNVKAKSKLRPADLYFLLFNSNLRYLTTNPPI